MLAGGQILGLSAHILDFGKLQRAVLLPLGQCGAGGIGMDVDFEFFIALSDDQTVTDGVKIGPVGFQIHVGVVLADNENGVEGEGDILIPQGGEVRLLLLLGKVGALGHGLALKLVQHPLEDHQKALAAGVHHPGLFQHGILLGGVF